MGVLVEFRQWLTGRKCAFEEREGLGVDRFGELDMHFHEEVARFVMPLRGHTLTRNAFDIVCNICLTETSTAEKVGKTYCA